MQLPIVAIAGYLLFAEPLDRWTALGAAVIFSANAYIAHTRGATCAPRGHQRAVEQPSLANRPLWERRKSRL